MERERRRKDSDRRFGLGRRMKADRRVAVFAVAIERRGDTDRRLEQERRTTFDRRSTTRRFSVERPRGLDSLPQ